MTFETLGKEIETRFTSVLSSVLYAANTIYSGVKARFIEEENREQIRCLLELDDDQLKDMGIARQDVKSSLVLPIKVSSGKYLEAVRRRVRR